MPSSRLYATGRTHTFTARGMAKLNYCKAAGISGPVEPLCPVNPTDTGWLGSNWFHPFQDQCNGQVGGTQFHGIEADSAFGGVLIWTGFVNPGIGDWRWRTMVILNGTFDPIGNRDPITPSNGLLVEEWDNGDAPENVSVWWTATVEAEEWAEELDSGYLEDTYGGLGSGHSVRPYSATDPQLTLYWVPTSDVELSCSGAASGSISYPLGRNIQLKSDLQLNVTVRWRESFLTAEAAGLDNLPEAAGMGDLPSPATIAEVSGMTVDGEALPAWTVNFFAQPGDSFSDTLSDLSSYSVNVGGPSFGLVSLTGLPRWDVPINGTVRDWNANLNNIPIQFDEGPVRSFTGRHVLDAQPRPVILPPSGYSSGDAGASRLLYGEDWTGLSLDRAASLVAEDFTRIGGANGWAGTDTTSAPVYAGGELVVTGTGGGSPRIDKTLKSDFDDITFDPNGWWAANGAGLPAAVQTWWANTGDPDSVPHKGDWWRIGKRLLNTSDVFNWSSYRYAELTGYADAACDVDLTVTWDEPTFAAGSGSSLFNVTLTHDVKTATWTIPLTTINAAHRIDLASLAGHDGLRYIRLLQVAFPTGRTIHLSQIELVEVARPKIDVHHPNTDSGYLTAVTDGKHALFLSLRQGKPGSLWGWPTLRAYKADHGGGIYSYEWGSHTLADLAAELSLQEGWTAAALENPDHGSPNYAVWLEERFELPVPATLSARRSFGEMTIYPNYDARGVEDIPLLANLGNALYVLAFDPDTRVPVRVPIEAVDGLGAVRDAATTDAIGAGRLEITTEEGIVVWAGRGTASQSSSSVNTFSRTLAFPWRTAKEEGTGGGPVVLDVDRIGNRWITRIEDDKVQVGRQLGAATTWEEFEIGSIGSDSWVHVDETLPGSPIRVVFCWNGTTIYEAASEANGTEGWKIKLIATGTHPFIRKDKGTGITYYLYWRDDTLWLKRSQDNGTTFLESEITVLTPVAEQTATFDFARDGSHTMLLVYVDGSGDVQQLESTDNGVTWN